MARGDVKSYRGRGGGGGGSYGYDDEGRGYSKDLWERFARDFELSGYSGKFDQWLDMPFLHNFWRNATWRFNKHDWRDRAHDLVIKKLGPKGWNDLLEYLDKAKEDAKDREFMNAIAYKIDRIGEHKASEAREAERIEKLEEEIAEYRNDADLTAGFLQSDFQNAISIKEKTSQPEGDWLDDVVEAYVDGYGWGEEVRTQTGIKLQITLSLDLSNSMYHNEVHEVAGQAFIGLWLALEELKADFQDSLFIKAFTFSDGREGKDAKVLQHSSWRPKPDNYGQGDHMGDVDEIFGYISKNKGMWWNSARDLYSGEDTWIAPLFEQIEKWEQTDETDPGAVRLDLIISDAVLEHPTDLRDASKIQERRDGSLQTVILNLMDEEDWHDSALPRRCYQYPVDISNLRGMLRNVLGEFVQVYA